MMLFAMIIAGTVNLSEAKQNKSDTTVTKCFGEQGLIYQGVAASIINLTVANSQGQSFYAFEDVKSKRQVIIFGICVQGVPSAQTANTEGDDFLNPNK